MELHESLNISPTAVATLSRISADLARCDDIVYIIQAGDTDMYKIGFSSNLMKRLATLQTASPHELRVVAVFEGDQSVEEMLHWCFAKYRTRGEWFNFPNREILTSFLDLIPATEWPSGDYIEHSIRQITGRDVEIFRTAGPPDEFQVMPVLQPGDIYTGFFDWWIDQCEGDLLFRSPRAAGQDFLQRFAGWRERVRRCESVIV